MSCHAFWGFSNTLKALGYIHREILTAIFIIGAVWPAMYGISFLQKHMILAATWFTSCLIMSTFTLLNAIKAENVGLMYVYL